MKGPSLDAIRKFKEQQERKKQEEDERKFREKLSTLEHRAAQGDRKAKIDLKRYEKAKEEQSRSIDLNIQQKSQQLRDPNRSKSSKEDTTKLPAKQSNVKPKRVETDFEELMRLAKNNNNELRVEKRVIQKSNTSQGQQSDKRRHEEVRRGSMEKPKPVQIPDRLNQHHDSNLSRKAPTQSTFHASRSTTTTQQRIQPAQQRPAVYAKHTQPHRSTTQAHQTNHSNNIRPPSVPQPRSTQQPSRVLPSYRPPNYGQPPRRPPMSSNPYLSRYQDEEDEDDYEDNYEYDDFVVDDDDDDARDELSKTLKSVFRYDKRRCDIRERELDREYRAIGRVSTFEDLEREERRASRLAAEEDSKALREEEERKRLKKIRLQRG